MLQSVSILSLGGTIAMTPSATGGVQPSLSANDLIGAVPGLGEIAHIETESIFNKPGAHLELTDLLQLADAVKRHAARGAAGIVITQGTDTIEETAFALDCLLDLPIPVIVTGAMRHPGLPGADGPANLFAATSVAVAPACRDLGVLVVMNDTIHAARHCRKTRTSLPSAFTSPNGGPLGWVSEGRVEIALRPSRRSTVVRPTGIPGRVALCMLALGDDGGMIELALKAGYGGIVLAALGGGHCSARAADRVAEAAAVIPVILASRTGAGPVLGDTYGFIGSERDLLARGAIGAGDLDPAKARMLLALLLGAAASRAEIAATFSVF